MLIISLLAHIQYCLERYRTRKSLASLTTDQLLDVGISIEGRQRESSKASLLGVSRDLLTRSPTAGGGS